MAYCSFNLNQYNSSPGSSLVWTTAVITWTNYRFSLSFSITFFFSVYLFSLLFNNLFSCFKFLIPTGITNLKRNNLCLHSVFEIEMQLGKRRQTFRFILVITVLLIIFQCSVLLGSSTTFVCSSKLS